jgi:hypothetical protein
MNDLYIPFVNQKLGFLEITEATAETIRRGLEQEENRFCEIIGALINVHKSDFNDARAIREKFGQMRAEVMKNGSSEYKLKLENVPKDCLYDGEHVIWAAVEQISSAFRDLIFAPEMPKGERDCAGMSAYVKKFVENAGFLYRGQRSLVVFTWGGHRINKQEYNFAKEIAYWLALAIPDIENITGCGGGIMKAPFKGSQVAYGKQRTRMRFGQRDFIGFTEKNILAAEPPNELVNRLVVFPHIEQRMEAFIRGAHRGRAHPGGAGTMEEVMFYVAMRLDPANRDIPYAFDLVEEKGGRYFLELDEFFKTCFGGDLLKDVYDLHLCTPREYADHVRTTSKKLPLRYLWNDDFVFDKRLQEPFEVSFEAMENLDLTRNQEPKDLLINLRRFFYSIVYLSVINPEMLDEWGNDLPLIHGERKIVDAADELVQKLVAQDRIHPNKHQCAPYRVS